jgi:protoporphyrinogen IX oxidase
MIYQALKVLHIAAIISWMTGVLYLYRILIYHKQQHENGDNHALLSIMGERLFRIITVPAMLASYCFGFGMIFVNPGLFSMGWLHAKLACVIILTAATVYAGVLQRRLRTRHGLVPETKSLRFWNEVPTLLMLLIIYLVIFKPF